MRIARLDLTRYGKFSDRRFDFGPAPVAGSDFHVVYGLNEAGKSTAAAAILDLLFGIGFTNIGRHADSFPTKVVTVDEQLE